MISEPHEGTFVDPAGQYWLIEYRHFPRKRLVMRPLRFDDKEFRFVIVGNQTPDLTPERWAVLRSFLHDE